jgi:hypothetical protein
MNKILKSSRLLKNIQNNDRKISDFCLKYEPSMVKDSYFKDLSKLDFYENSQVLSQNIWINWSKSYRKVSKLQIFRKT